MTKLLNLTILGPQGSGKGTQAALLVEKFGYIFIGAGEALREIAGQDTKLGRKVHETINVQGRFVEPELISQVMQEKLKNVPKNQPVIIDGYPRSLKQYELFKKFWSGLGRGDYKVIFLELSEEEAVKRLSTRFVCEVCGGIYIGNQGKCQKCGGHLTQREDDKAEAVRTRLRLFNSETLPVIEEVEKEGRLIRINGASSIEEVHREILEKLNLSQ